MNWKLLGKDIRGIFEVLFAIAVMAWVLSCAGLMFIFQFLVEENYTGATAIIILDLYLLFRWFKSRYL